MLLLTNIANENPELLKNIPEFLCQNINDVTGLLRFVTNVWHNFYAIFLTVLIWIKNTENSDISVMA